MESMKQDWSQWLPKDPLPNSGPKVFTVGQIWATNDTGPGDTRGGEVWRVDKVGPRGDVEESTGLVGGGRCPSKDSYCATHSVLVADVGCEPIPPDALAPVTQLPPMMPVAERELTVTFDGEKMRRYVDEVEVPIPSIAHVSHRSFQQGCDECVAARPNVPYRGYPSANLAERGDGIRAKTLPPAKPAPWRPSVDEVDLLPDVRERGWRR